jgi:hypothetical protein
MFLLLQKCIFSPHIISMTTQHHERIGILQERLLPHFRCNIWQTGHDAHHQIIMYLCLDTHL